MYKVLETKCELYYKNAENADYWFFKIDKENNLWLYIDDKAVGTYKFQEDTGIETLEIDFSLYGNKGRYIVRWKADQ